MDDDKFKPRQHTAWRPNARGGGTDVFHTKFSPKRQHHLRLPTADEMIAAVDGSSDAVSSSPLSQGGRDGKAAKNKRKA